MNDTAEHITSWYNLYHYCGGDNYLVAPCPWVPKKLGPLLKEEWTGIVKFSINGNSFGSRIFAGVTLSQTLEHQLYLKLICFTSWDTDLDRKDTKSFLIDLNVSSSLQASTLVDLGLDLSMVGKAFFISTRAAMYPWIMHLQLEVIDGSMLKTGNITHYTFLTFKYCKYSFQFKFHVLNHSHCNIGLRLDWQQKFNSKIIWKKLTLKWQED